MDKKRKKQFKEAAANFRRWVDVLNNSLPHLDVAERLIVEGTGTLVPDATIEQNAAESLRKIAKRIDEITGGYDYLMDALGLKPRYRKQPRRK